MAKSIILYKFRMQITNLGREIRLLSEAKFLLDYPFPKEYLLAGYYPSIASKLESLTFRSEE